MVTLALIPYLALSAALDPLVPIMSEQLHRTTQAMSLSSGLGNDDASIPAVAGAPSRRRAVRHESLHPELQAVGRATVRGARRRPVRRAGLRRGVVTNQIETFTETGILLKSGRELYADIIVTAKALDMLSRLGGSEYQRVMATAVRRFFPWANKR
ncbi:MAG: hypothetical protein QOC76_1132 [Mycobacterium sp.]|jgi:hypothetical protein|nr:hypothetical protein [Mycobacterium sp.]